MPFFEHLFGDPAGGGVVVDHQNLHSPKIKIDFLLDWGLGGQAFKSHREIKTAALPHLTGDAELAAHEFYQLRGNCQTQPGPAVTAGGFGVHLLEGAENAFLLVSGNADAGVLH